MRVVQMYPEEEGFARLRVQPLNRPVNHDARAALRVFPKLVGRAGLGHLVVVNIKAQIESEYPLQDRGTDERRRIPTLFLEDLRQRPG